MSKVIEDFKKMRSEKREALRRQYRTASEKMSNDELSRKFAIARMKYRACSSRANNPGQSKELSTRKGTQTRDDLTQCEEELHAIADEIRKRVGNGRMINRKVFTR